jgi:para-aminobenzoate synthetase component 1
VRVERLGAGGAAADVLLGLHERARRLRLPPPAALTGRWFGSAAVLAPSLDARAVAGIPEVATSPGPDGAVGGGWIGYRGYPDGAGVLPPAAGGWTSSVLRLDVDGCWWFESLQDGGCPADLASAVRTGGRARPWEVQWRTPDEAQHHGAVEQCLAAITDGEVYQACVCTRFVGRLSGDPVQLFTDGVRSTGPARAAFVAGSWGAVASLSPELFLARHGRAVRSSPIKGTLPIGQDPALLRSSAKDVAENVMIVDLVRNDLGRVCVPGSITVPELLAVQPAPAVWHLVSTVTGLLRVGTSDAELVEALFPPASVTGTPKLRARTLLAGWEAQPRGAYCGAVGMVSPWAGLELNVAIRTVEVDPEGRVELGVGGGITSDSDPTAEWRECLAKASAVTGLRSSAAAGTAYPRAASTAS